MTWYSLVSFVDSLLEALMTLVAFLAWVVSAVTWLMVRKGQNPAVTDDDPLVVWWQRAGQQLRSERARRPDEREY